ncbi:U-box domain-containing protein 14 [Hirschfeldia incana]|nr:U-box domain-containing protein 14 [Hirschfeldia incana]
MGSTNVSHEELMTRLVDSVKQISKFSSSKGFFGRIQGDLVRRITLLSPFFEELIDISSELNEEQLTGFEVLRIALDSSLELFRSVNEGSKLLQIVHRGSVVQKFHDATVEIEAALTQIPYDLFEVSEEVREQVQLLHFQFKRATERREEEYDLQLSHDLAIAESAVDPDPEILKRLSQELQLSTIDELKKESHAIHEYFLSHDGDPDDCFQRMSSLLKKLVDCATDESSEPDASTGSKTISRHRSPVIPEYFRCPISLELMKDPVIVSTGQTYERSSIQKWLDAGHKTCPKSQETLLHSGLTPNYVLKSLIALWCESNGIELPQNQGSSYRTTRPGGGGGSSSSDCDRAFVLALLEKLDNGTTEQQRAAAGELRLLAKRNADNRVCIAEAGAIPLLVERLSSPDPRTQEHSVTALLNLSINEGNKGAIVDAGAITDIVEVLKNGSMEARENAAATLFSLSVVDENKVAIGAAGAIQALISLLEEGTRRGKKDAATAIFNLCIYQGNKSRAIKGGIVDPLTRLLKDAGGGMVDEALAILAILSTNQEGKAAIAEADTIPVLVEIIRTGSPRNRENAAAILWYLCVGNVERLNVAREVGADVALKELTENGTDRAKRKAASLLEIIQQLEGVAISTVP